MPKSSRANPTPISLKPVRTEIVAASSFMMALSVISSSRPPGAISVSSSSSATQPLQR